MVQHEGGVSQAVGAWVCNFQSPGSCNTRRSICIVQSYERCD